MKLTKLLKVLSTLFLVMTIHGLAFAQGVTTASMNGFITDNTGETLIGANILAVHLPSGSTYGNSTDLNGFYRIPNMRVGGPYRITISYTGYENTVKENIYLALGQSYQLNAELQETAIQLEAAVVTARATDIFDGNRDGQQTVVDERTINDIPTISRAIGDYARFNPLASIGEDEDGFEISLAGQNNRYNTIYIDGAVNNDAFGLAGSGTNGGQTGVQPISIDAIEQFTIAVAPFDVRQSGFAGGAINAVTRSGTNEFEGSAYYFWRNEDLAGETPLDDDQDIERTKLDPFSAKTYGFRLGGPIVKNKLFFFVNGELQRDETPMPFQFENYRGDADMSILDQLRARMGEFGYDPGTFINNTSFLNSDKILAKFDWNINQNHKLSFRHSYVKAENLEARSSSNFSLNFENGSEYFVSNTNSSALELSSLFSPNLSNKLTIGMTFVRDDRDPFGTPFPTLFFEDGDDGGINLGAERFSTANLLNQDVITINNDLTFYQGRHSLLVGVNFEYFNAGNLFIRNNYGRYQWFNTEDDDGNIVSTGLEDFLNGEPASRFERSFSQVDNIAGDESNAIAEISQMLIGVYLQDEFQATNNLKLTAGLRVDVPIWPDDQPVNEDFNNNTIPAIESFGYDLQGARTGSFISSQILFSPRLGFNWDVTGQKKTQLRGGVGIFTSRIPLVWPGGAYNNYGLNIGETGRSNVDFEPDVNRQPVGFQSDGTPILQIDPNNLVASGQIDLFAEDFKLPQVLKANLAVDHKLPWGLVGTLEALYTKNINNVFYQNFNLKPARGTLTGTPDDRPVFSGVQAQFGDDVIDPTYTNIMLASNTNKGYGYNLAASLSKQFTKGFAAMVAYSYGDAFTVLDGTSSQNNSQWRGYYNVQGRNEIIDEPERSSFAAGHRVFGQVSYELDYPTEAGFGGKSKLSLNFNGQTGGFFSYVVGARNFLFIDDGGFDNNELIYIPNNQDEINLVDITDRNGNLIYTVAQQWNVLDAFINDDPHLNDRRGDYAQRNGAREPFEFVMDMRFLQDFYIKMNNGKKNILQFSVDVFNFTNLLNKDWGRRRFSGSFGAYPLLNLVGNTLGDNPEPRYTVNTEIMEGNDPWTNRLDDSGFRSSRWQMQLGVRYIFQ